MILSVNCKIIYIGLYKMTINWIYIYIYIRGEYITISTLLHFCVHFLFISFSFLSVTFVLIRNSRYRRKSKLDHAIIRCKILHVAKRRIFTDHSIHGNLLYWIIVNGRIDMGLNH